MFPRQTLKTLALYRWSNEETYHDYPYIAIAADHSVVMSLGDYGLTFEWSLPADVAGYLAADFSPTGESISCDIATMRQAFEAVFARGVKSGIVRFTRDLRPRLIDLGLYAQVMAEDGPEYLLQGLRDYRRIYREPVRVGPVTLGERAMLDVCAATFTELAAQCSAQLCEPLPPRFRGASADPGY